MRSLTLRALSRFFRVFMVMVLSKFSIVVVARGKTKKLTRRQREIEREGGGRGGCGSGTAPVRITGLPSMLRYSTRVQFFPVKVED